MKRHSAMGSHDKQHPIHTVTNGSLQELGEKFSINNDPILHFDFFWANQALALLKM